MASLFARAGIETHAFDLRGFGASGGPRAYLGRWYEYHDDLEDRLAGVRKAAGELRRPYGHSMGGLIALGYILADPPVPSPTFLFCPRPRSPRSSPDGNELSPTCSKRHAADGGRQRSAARWAIARSSVEVAYRSDPLNVHRTTTRLGMELFHEQARVNVPSRGSARSQGRRTSFTDATTRSCRCRPARRSNDERTSRAGCIQSCVTNA